MAGHIEVRKLHRLRPAQSPRPFQPRTIAKIVERHFENLFNLARRCAALAEMDFTILYDSSRD